MLAALTPTTTWYLLLAAVLFSIGVVGVMVRRNPLVLFMCIELMLNAVNLTFVALARRNGDEQEQGAGNKQPPHMAILRFYFAHRHAGDDDRQREEQRRAGQLADHGTIALGNGALVEVHDVQTPVPGLWVHRGRVIDGSVEVGQSAISRVDVQRRLAISRAHTATHMVHKAFRGAEILYTLKLSSGRKVLALVPSHHNHALGEQIGIRLDVDHVVAFSPNA